MKLTLNDETNFNIRWYQLDLGNVTGGLPHNIADTTALKVYSGDPFVRSAGGAVANSNHLMGSGVMQNNGTAHIVVNDTTAGSPGYVLISTTSRVFYVTADINQSATANDVFGFNIISPSAFKIGALNPDDFIHSVDSITFPMQTGANIVSATIDTMTVAFTDILPNNVTQAQNNAPVAMLNARSAANAVTWQGLTVQRTGQNRNDSDIIHVNVWKDINADNSFEDGNPVPISPLAASIGAGDLSLQVAVSTGYPGSGVLYIDSELIQYTSTGPANTFIGLVRGFLGTVATIHSVGSNVYGVVNDTLVGDNLSKPGLVTNGTNNFTNGVATLTFVTPQIVPTTINSPNGAGVNYFVTYDINPFAPSYIDLNNDGIRESPGEDVTLGALIGGTTSFTVLAPKVVALVTTPPLTTKLAGILEYKDAVLFTPDDSIVPLSATQGDKDVPILKFTMKTPVSFATLSSLKIARIGQGAVQTQGSNEDIAQVKIYRDANFNGILDPTVDVLIGTGTFITPDPTGTAAKATVINLFKTETINPTGQTYFIAYDIATGATSNNSEGLTIQDPGWFSGSFVPNGADTMRADNLPHDSRQISISPLLVRVKGTSLAPASALQGTSLVPLLAVNITPSINQVIISTLTLTQTGTIQYSIGAPPVVGDGDFAKLYVYLDTNLNGLLDPATDTLVGSIPWGGLAFSSGTAIIPLSSPVTFNTSGGTLLIAADIATIDGSGTSTQGHFAGIQISSSVAIAMSPSTALQDPNNVYPVASAPVPIFNLQTVEIATITMRPDLTNDETSPVAGTYFPEAWVNRQDQVQAAWITSPPMPLPSNVSIAYQIGVSATSNTSVPPTLTGWVTITAPPPVTLTGLGLSDASVYYFHVRTLTTINGLALPPSPVKVGTIHVDVSKPAPAGAFLNLPTSAPSGVITVQWAPSPNTGPSGLFSYKIRQFVDGSPVPVEIVQTSTPSFTFGSGQQSGAPSFATAHALSAGVLGGLGTASPLQYLNGESGGPRAPGHFYRYQIETINGAGTASDWSAVSATINTGLPTEVISDVTNYPNPVDTRKGGIEGKTCINYLLASDAQVDIVIYDLLGYRVMGWSFAAGSPGGMQGSQPNSCVPAGGWDGTNESGQKVSKGGYLAQIKVGGAKGSTTVIRKIGVIH